MSTPKDKSNCIPRKIVNYAIPCDPKGGALYIFGNADAKNMAIVCAGFPDDHSLFVPFASRLAENTDTLVGVMCLPGYDNRKDKPWNEHQKDKKDGYSFNEWASCVREAAKELRSESSLPSKPKFTGIFHDWGVVAGSIWSNRAKADGGDNAPDELVYFDVLPNPHPSCNILIEKISASTFRQYVASTYYQLLLGFSFILQRYVATALAVVSIIMGSITMKLLKIQPTCKLDDDVATHRASTLPLAHIIYMCYPYKNAYKDFSKIDWSKRVWKSDIEDNNLPKDLSKVPVLYMYGTKKRINFHENATVEFLKKEIEENKSKSNVVAVNDAGHYLHVQKPDICFDAVCSFMQKE